MDASDSLMTPERAEIIERHFAGVEIETAAKRISNMVVLALGTQIENLERIDHNAVLDTLDFSLRDLGSGNPDVSLHDEMLRRDAELWARRATPSELAAYGAACLRHMPERTMHNGLLRRVLANVWQRLDPTDRRRFLEKVGAETKGRSR